MVVLSEGRHLYLHKFESNESMLNQLILYLKSVNFLFFFAQYMSSYLSKLLFILGSDCTSWYIAHLSLYMSMWLLNAGVFSCSKAVLWHGVQRRMISVDSFFVFLRLLSFALLLLYET